MTTGNALVDRHVEQLCDDGCAAVRGYIQALRADQEQPHWAGLSEQERALLLRELETIMDVYGDVCRL